MQAAMQAAMRPSSHGDRRAAGLAFLTAPQPEPGSTPASWSACRRWSDRARLAWKGSLLTDSSIKPQKDEGKLLAADVPTTRTSRMLQNSFKSPTNKT